MSDVDVTLALRGARQVNQELSGLQQQMEDFGTQASRGGRFAADFDQALDEMAESGEVNISTMAGLAGGIGDLTNPLSIAAAAAGALVAVFRRLNQARLDSIQEEAAELRRSLGADFEAELKRFDVIEELGINFEQARQFKDELDAIVEAENKRLQLQRDIETIREREEEDVEAIQNRSTRMVLIGRNIERIENNTAEDIARRRREADLTVLAKEKEIIRVKQAIEAITEQLEEEQKVTEENKKQREEQEKFLELLEGASPKTGDLLQDNRLLAGAIASVTANMEDQEAVARRLREALEDLALARDIEITLENAAADAAASFTRALTEQTSAVITQGKTANEFIQATLKQILRSIAEEATARAAMETAHAISALATGNAVAAAAHGKAAAAYASVGALAGGAAGRINMSETGAGGGRQGPPPEAEGGRPDQRGGGGPPVVQQVVIIGEPDQHTLDQLNDQLQKGRENRDLSG